MGRELISLYPVFSRSIQASEEEIIHLGASWVLTTEITNPESISRIKEAEFSQPCCTAIQIALVDLLESWGVRPDLVCGHSSGEIAAAYAAKILTAQDAIKVAFFRGKIAKALKEKSSELAGGMLAVGLSEPKAQDYVRRFGGQIAIACINSPSSVTLSGDRTALEALQPDLDEKSIFNLLLHVDVAYHSHHMKLVAEDYRLDIEGITPTSAGNGIKMISSVTGREIRGTELGTSYWTENLVSPVRFSDALSNVLRYLALDHESDNAASMSLVVEVGPHSALQKPILQIFNSSIALHSANYLSVLSRNTNSAITAMKLAGKLFSNGINIKLDTVNDPKNTGSKQIIVDLPPYQWHHETSHWGVSRRTQSYQLRKFPRHDLLGVLAEDSVDIEPTWRNYLRHSELPWLKGHCIQGQTIYPAAGYISMIVEALKQQSLIAGRNFEHTNIHFRQVTIKAPITILENTSGIETLVHIRPFAYSVREDSTTWKEFRVFSFSGSESTEHCRGLVTIMTGESTQLGDITKPPLSNADLQVKKEPETQSWTRLKLEEFYKDLNNIGLTYSWPFTSMESALVGHLQTRCTVKIPNIVSCMPSEHQAPHEIHPATLDSCFQTAFLGMRHANELNTTFVVSEIEELLLSTDIVSQPNKELNVETWVHRHRAFQMNADVAVANPDDCGGGLVLHAKGVTFTALDHQPVDTEPMESEAPFCQLEWQLDPFLSSDKSILNHCRLESPNGIQNLKARFDQYCRSIIRQTLNHLSAEDEQEVNGYRIQLLKWMRSQDPGSVSIFNEDLEDDIVRGSAQGEMLFRLHKHLRGILRGEVDALSILLQDDLLDRIYLEDSSLNRCHSQLAKYVQLAKFKTPGIRILEIGGGTGSLTVTLTEVLFGVTATRNAGKYVFTDISTAFFTRAESKLEKFKGFIDYRKLDIEIPPKEQGFEIGSFDLIVASNVLHATREMKQTLAHIRSLLKPNGRIAIVEITKPSLRLGFWACLPGWWRGLEDDRDLSPLLSTSGWDKVLKSNGFSGANLEMKDYDSSDEHELSLIISSLVPKKEADSTGEVKIVTLEEDNGVSSSLSDIICSNEHLQIVSQASLSKTQPSGGIFILLLELERPFLVSPSLKQWEKLRDIINHADAILWVTRGGAIECPEPTKSLVTGLARSCRSENHEQKFVTLDLDFKTESEAQMADDIWCVYERTLGQKALERPMMEWEFAVRGGSVLIPRLVRDSKMKDYIQDTVSKYHPRLEAQVQPDRALALGIGSPGLLDSLYWSDAPAHSMPPNPDQVRVKIHYASLNFKDLMVAMGQLSGISTPIFEGCGTVIEVGDAANGIHSVGDTVYVFNPQGLATVTNSDATCVHPVPKGMNMEMVAAIPVAYATALYSLRDAANIKPGESVLIHSGAGAVGQAAIALAKYFGAGEIFVTVGSSEKGKFLKQEFSVPEENIFPSRGIDFGKAVLKQTKGRGVDVVLNSLTGDAIRESCSILAPFGRFVEIGKKDIQSNGRLEMQYLEKNITFTVVDLALLALKRPKIVQGLIQNCLELVHFSKTKAISPITIKPIAEIGEHFRSMQAGKHIGKLLVKMTPTSMIMVGHYSQ